MPSPLSSRRLLAAIAVVTAATAPGIASADPGGKQLYFGETHVHTGYSLDAYLGGTRLAPGDAYRFARGEAVVVNGVPHRLRRPLDFAAVTDHAEYLGEMYAAWHPGSPGHDHPQIQQLISMTDFTERRTWFIEYVIKGGRGARRQHSPFFPGEPAVANAWQVEVDAAAEHYEPGVFTTFNAYEWTSAPGGANLHRNVIFRGDQVPAAPKSAIDIPTEEALWGWLQSQARQGARAMALPHNSNASKGRMFPAVDSAGAPIDGDYARLRGEFERAIEVMQVKGNSEVTRRFWAADEFADFENADSIAQFSDRVPMKENYIRYGVVQGLADEARLGANPFKLGFVGGTDSHNGVPGDTDEYSFVGGHGAEDGTPAARQTAVVGGWLAARDENPGALTAVWAAGNNREAIWDAIHARETYATSGTRIALRFFGGWDYDSTMLAHPDVIERAYARGVPMGGDLKNATATTAPRFLVLAGKDPLGANLDRVQIVKGWVDAEGNTHDRVFNVAWSGDRAPGADGGLPPVGNTVDLATATYRNTIGSAELAAVWVDPEFDPAQRALYYVRVLEIPTPRWTTYDAVRAQLPPLADEPATIQERAWSSPIWYSP